MQCLSMGYQVVSHTWGVMLFLILGILCWVLYLGYHAVSYTLGSHAVSYTQSITDPIGHTINILYSVYRKLLLDK
jgi:hypothetical protein